MKFRLLALAFATPVLVTTTASAGTTQAQITVSNIAATVRDINTSDGVAASFSWRSKWGSDARFDSQHQTAWTVAPGGPGHSIYAASWEDGPGVARQATFPWTSFSLVSPNGQGRMEALLDGSGELQHLTLDTHVAPANRQAGLAFATRGFVLGAGSEVDISVTLAGLVSVAAAKPVVPVPGGITYPDNGRAEIKAVLTDFAGIGSASFSQLVTNEAFHQTGAVSSSFDQQVLTLTYRNTGTEPLAVFLDLQLSAKVYEISTAVPEPASWGLMAAGLLAVSIARRRRS